MGPKILCQFWGFYQIENNLFIVLIFWPNEKVEFLEAWGILDFQN
jgi:hypothetical protein